MYIQLYTWRMSKRYSIAEARANLPTIVDEVEVGKPVELTRRGKPVAVVVSREHYDRLTAVRSTFVDAYRAFCAKFDVEDVGLDAEFVVALRSAGAGRKVTL